jgi:hypothetical protein
MTCPICDQKPMNCDCTEKEKRQWSEIEDLRLTDSEREAIEAAVRIIDAHEDEMDGFPSGASATLRGLLGRLA